ncbi:hypothetical protein SASPL_125800 [Salvia splendens]|uniref:Tetratricopeptide repeat protein 1 n=1 Tax=Salvia splendens TaxID=180675 RepID=A0A8X8ZR26_SALSN|nr:tetratricopeptide repeat protein 1-like [Salvia splendens]KAG6413099.1 hypothetical protein SASPL_125800 [Salvia splendens]
MAVIEQDSSGEEDCKSQPRAPAAAASGYSTDGYETASDTELNDAVPGQDTHSRSNGDSAENGKSFSSEANGNADGQVKVEQQREQTVTVDKDDAEKALARANDVKLEGNLLFKDGLYEDALSKYGCAIQNAPVGDSSSEIRSICHANSATCFFKLQKYEESVKECTKALELNPTYMKALLRRAEAREKLEQYEESITDMTKVIELDPANDQARRAIIRLKPLADEKREKMKEEMIGKLKEMGNSILGRFGMSVDNFKAVKDPNTGSYSVSFQN